MKDKIFIVIYALFFVWDIAEMFFCNGNFTSLMLSGFCSLCMLAATILGIVGLVKGSKSKGETK